MMPIELSTAAAAAAVAQESPESNSLKKDKHHRRTSFSKKEQPKNATEPSSPMKQKADKKRISFSKKEQPKNAAEPLPPIKQEAANTRISFSKKEKPKNAAEPSSPIPGTRGILKNEENKISAPSDEIRRVSFSKLEIHEFLMQLGDNPSCEGAPVCISNEHQRFEIIDVNLFETTRKARRHRKQLAISATKRSRM
jgi:hypothetical protein